MNTFCLFSWKVILAGSFLLVGLSHLSAGQSTPAYWGDLSPGSYVVGMKRLFLIDSSRPFDFLPSESTIKSQNTTQGRPLLTTVFFPVRTSSSLGPLTIRDLFEFDGSPVFQPLTDAFYQYEMRMSKQFAIEYNLPLDAFSENQSMRDSVADSLFDAYLSTRLFASDETEIPKKPYPVLIYHQGLGGSLDEHFLMAEYLASHGFIVVTSSFFNKDATTFLGVGDTDASIRDIDFILDYLKKMAIGDPSAVFLMGHSFGANTVFNYPQIGKHAVSGIITLDSDYGYVLSFMMPANMQPDLKSQSNYNGVRIMGVGRAGAGFRMMDLIDRTTRTFIIQPTLSHNDFCSQTIVGLYPCLPYLNNKEERKKTIRAHFSTYPLILSFLRNNQLPNQHLSIAESSAPVVYQLDPGDRLATNRPFNPVLDTCPTGSQLIDLIHRQGMREAGKAWLLCSDLKDTTRFQTDWLYVFEALLKDRDEQAVDFIRWYLQNRAGNYKMGAFVYFMLNGCFIDNGDGYRYEIAKKIAEEMAVFLSTDLAVMKAQLFCKQAEYYLEQNANRKKSIQQSFVQLVTHLFTLYPAVLDSPPENGWDETFNDLIRPYHKSK